MTNEELKNIMTAGDLKDFENPPDSELVELDQEFIVLAIPDTAVELDIVAKVHINHELRTVVGHMDFTDIRAAIREAQDGYIPKDALFSLAPVGEEKMKDLVQRYLGETEEE